MPTHVAASLHLTLFGGFNLLADGQAGPSLPKRTRALLAYLAVERDKPITREAAGELLWPLRGEGQVKASLSQALYELRQVFPGQDIVTREDGRLALGGQVASDAAVFAAHPNMAAIEPLQQAASAYSGPLLHGFPSVSSEFDDWLVVTRARMENRALDVLAHLADAWTAAGNAAATLATTERMFAIDPLREDIHRLLLTACAAAGRRADALRYYERIVDVLRRDLGVAPSEATRGMAGQLRQEMDPVPAGKPATTVTPRASSAGPPIAVLPFRQFGEEFLPRHVREGLVADIVGQLACLRELSVISHGSTIGLGETEQDPRGVGRMLGVRYVVRGTIRQDGNAIRLTTDLVDAETGFVVRSWQHRAGSLASFDDQDRVVAQVVNTLAPRVREVELQRIRGRRPESLSVYEKTLLVREHLLRLDRAGFAEARQLLDAIIAEEPGYAEAYALDADWHGLFLSQGWSNDRETHINAVDLQTRHALDLDGDNLRALIFHAHRKSLHHRDFDTAQNIFRHALDVSPNSAKAWLWSSLTFSYVGEVHEAVRRAERALSLSPRDREAHEFYTALNVAHYSAGDYRAAADWGLKAIGEPSVMRAIYWWTAASLAAAGDGQRAREIAQIGMEQMPNRRIRDAVANSPFKDEDRRSRYGQHLLAAGFHP